MNTKYCTKCGNLLNINDNYCNSCGNKVEKSTNERIYKNYSKMTYSEKKAIIMEMKIKHCYNDNISDIIKNITIYIYLPLFIVRCLFIFNEFSNDILWILLIIILLLAIIGYIDEKIQIETYLKSKKENR